MRRRAATRSLVLAAVAAVAVSGCSGSSQPLDPGVRNLQAGAPGKPNTVLTETSEEVRLGSPFHEADVAFMRDMQVHHRQALAMTALVPSRAGREDLTMFARRMDISQEGEIDQLDQLLAEHDAAVAKQGGGHGSDHGSGHAEDADHSDMPGMMTAAQMAQLEAATGEQFVRLFLDGMTRHHQGAIAMVQQLLDTPGAAAEQRVYEFAWHVQADQDIEISRMARMKATLKG